VLPSFDVHETLAPTVTRTRDNPLRRRVLYPAELWARASDPRGKFRYATRNRLALHPRNAASSWRHFRDVHPIRCDRDDEKYYYDDQQCDQQVAATSRLCRLRAWYEPRAEAVAIEPVHIRSTFRRTELQDTIMSIVAKGDDRHMNWSGGQVSNLRPVPPKGTALPTELPPVYDCFRNTPLRHLPSELYCGLSAMAVCTSHLAFRQLGLKPLSARIAPDESADLAILRAGYMVEF
jgi:hypothetical protein